MQKHSLLADLIDIREQIERDQNTGRNDLQQRDRKIGLEFNRPQSPNAARLQAWIAALRKQQDPDKFKSSSGANAQHTFNILVLLLWLVGLIFGWLLTQAVLYYDGNQPVNILVALLVLVCSQVLSLMLLLVLSAGGLRRPLQSLSILNPASMLLGLIKRLNPDRLESISATLSAGTIAVSAGLKQRLLIYLAQHFTVALNLGIIAGLLYLVAVSDLAFGWNTTLAIDTPTVTSWFNALAWPWQSMLPSAVPDAELVEASRYYRLQGQLRSGDWEAEQLGRWWVYILMCILVYGLIPRLIALIASGIIYDRALISAITAIPGSSQVLARMSSPLIATQAVDKEQDELQPGFRPPLSRRQIGHDLPCIIVEWSESRVDKARLAAMGIKPVSTFSAGGHQTLSEDRDIVRHIAKYRPKGVGVIVKAWESPMLEILDFVTNLRKNIDPSCPIIILLSAIPGTKTEAQQLEVWEASLGKLSDPALYVEPV